MDKEEPNKSKWPMYSVVAIIAIIVIVFISSGNSSEQQLNTVAPTTNTFYVNGEVNVRKCAAITCDSYGKYSFDGGFTLPYKSISDMPDWVEVSFTYTPTGETIDGYISKSLFSLNQNSVDNSSGQNSQQQIQQQQVSNQTQNQQKNNLTPQPVIQPAPKTASEIYADISPRLAFIRCNWYNRYGSVLFSKSMNGLLGPLSTKGTYFINTVLGGVTDTQYAGYMIYPSTCDIQFPAGRSLYAGGLSTFTSGSYNNYGTGLPPAGIANLNVDFAQIINMGSNNYLSTYARPVNYCLSRPLVGDSVVVFGWPESGTNQTLTGTITSTSGYYDNTNISIPNGMQGSTAISSSTGCVLGQINALGQIVDQGQLSYLFGF